jgi:hypothetical protein
VLHFTYLHTFAVGESDMGILNESRKPEFSQRACIASNMQIWPMQGDINMLSNSQMKFRFYVTIYRKYPNCNRNGSKCTTLQLRLWSRSLLCFSLRVQLVYRLTVELGSIITLQFHPVHSIVSGYSTNVEVTERLTLAL